MADSDYDEENETYFITQNTTILRTLQSAYGSIDGSDDGELNSEAAGERSLEKWSRKSGNYVARDFYKILVSAPG